MHQNKSNAVDVAAEVGGGTNDFAPAPIGAGMGLRGVERWLARRMLSYLHDPPIRIVLWNGEEVACSRESPVARVVMRDRGALYRLISDPDFQFGELYSSGRLTIEGDLMAFLDATYRSTSANGTYRGYLSDWFHRPRLNTARRARENVHQHYDIGNDFYRLWLDEAMVYTCAYFPTRDATLEAAQQAKLEHVCRKLRLTPGERVVEAGCGWGSLAMYMAEHHGVKVKAYNISHQQIIFARERAAAKGLADRVEFIEDDYRNITGTYDAFVSVGMLEHVGPKDYPTLGRVIDRCLTDSGRGLIHSIGRNRPLRMNAWIATRIFPGGYTPAISEMTRILEPYSLSVLDVENLRLHYALTLEHWLARFERSTDKVRQMFDERFVRMWRLYLAGSLMAFATGWMQLFQITFARPLNNDLPLTRGHLYRTGK
ncbi:MAG: cyclopropane-fatty-acyl-phospholipid synthase family protein [Planctomycetes bacterium]|nr:cyclopropane-fatty-acyl-phospholipid synthase family protein [Planctomycetota bacterium]